MKTALLSYLKYNDFNPIESGLSVNYYGNNSKSFSFPLRNITANGSGITLVFNNTTDVSLTHYIVNTENTTLLKRIGFSISSGKLDLSTSYGSIVESITVSTSSFQQYSIDLQENPISNLVVYTTASELPTRGILAAYMYVPEVNIETSKYNIISKSKPISVYYAYVANRNSDTVSVIDTESNKVITTIAVQSFPYDVAISGNGYFVYVTNENSNTVSVIQTSKNSVVASIKVGTSPTGICVSPSGEYVYVANNGSNTVSVIQTSTNTVIATISIKSPPEGIAVTPDGSYVYVTTPHSNNVSVIQTSKNTVISNITVDGQPYAIAVTPNGDYAYVTNQGSNTVSVIQTSTNTVIDTITVGSEPTGIVVSPDGSYVYVVYFNQGAISVITVAENTVITYSLDAISFGVAVIPTGEYLYVPSFNTDSVFVVDTSTMKTVDIITVESPSVGIAIT